MSLAATYLERGQPVTIICGWGRTTGQPCDTTILWIRPPGRTGPRNVYIERGDGTQVVRPFRGLRKVPA